MKLNPTIVILIFVLSFSSVQAIYGQSSYEENLELFNSKEYTTQDLYDLFIERLNDAKKTEDQYQYAKLLLNASYRLTKTKEFDKWIRKTDSLASHLSEVPYDKSHQLLLISIAHGTKKTSKAIALLKDMSEHALSSGDTTWMIDYHVKSARAYAQYKDKAEVLKNILAAENLNEQYKGIRQEGLIQQAKATMTNEDGNHEKTIEHLLNAIDAYEQLESPGKNLLLAYSDLVNEYRSNGKNDKTDPYLIKISQIQQELGCQPCYFSNELNRIFFLINDGQYQEAVDLADKTILYAEDNVLDPSHAIYLMGVAYRGLDRYDKAAPLILRAFDLAKEIKHNGKCSFYSHALYQTYYWKENYADALSWYKTHKGYQDSVYNENKIKEVAVYESKLEALEQKRIVEELEAKAIIDKQKKRALWITILLGSFLGLALLYAQRLRGQREKIKQEALLENTKLEKEKLSQQLEFKQKELSSQLLNMTQKNNLLMDMKSEIEVLKSENKQVVSKLVRKITKSIENTDEWDQFLNTFKSIHSSFITNLNQLSTNLTSNEIRLASLMKMNISSKEIATMLNISEEGVKKARYRLRKKLSLDSSINMHDYLLKL